jgi:hypothetical protein
VDEDNTFPEVKKTPGLTGSLILFEIYLMAESNANPTPWLFDGSQIVISRVEKV